MHSAQGPGVLPGACLNATQAAIRAGYSDKTANAQASQNLSKLNVANRISGLKADALVTKREVTKKVTTEKLVSKREVSTKVSTGNSISERQIVEANTEVIAREKIYLTSLREPGTWPTVLHCKSVSYRVSSTAASR
ncbi:terminase small subunit [Edwardsiella tarda]|uniref:terminase small subunit n=1 Tax=Edwardsiella tarda TaxID=636 RepID=UPI0015E7FE8D|nr:terminase small subunit [Edwardsiella tarda]